MVAAATTESVNSKVKTILVTGATSMVGKELVRESFRLIQEISVLKRGAVQLKKQKGSS
jgi:short-subunit dehydrogenase